MLKKKILYMKNIVEYLPNKQNYNQYDYVKYLGF